MTFWSRLFGRKPARRQPPRFVDKRGMSEDWRPGDLALCIDGRWIPHSDVAAFFPRQGELLRVSDISCGVSVNGKALITGLAFEGRPSHLFWWCEQFRKIRPDNSAADTEAEWVKRIKRGPKVGA